jgi:hypothetical protein
MNADERPRGDADLPSRVRYGLAAAARAAVVSPNGWDEIQGRIRAGRVRRAALATVAAVAVIGLGVGVYAGRDTDSRVHVVADEGHTAPGAPLPRLVPTWLPDGLELQHLTRFPTPIGGAESFGEFVEVWREPGTDGTTGPTVAIVVVPAEHSWIDRPGSTITEVAGHRASRLEHGDAVTLSWEVDDLVITLTAWDLPDAEVLSLAESVEPANQEGALARSPMGLERVVAGPVREGQSQHLSYEDPAATYEDEFVTQVDRFMIVSTTRVSDPGAVTWVPAWRASERVRVRGVTGLFLTTPFEPDLTLVWPERSDVAVSIFSKGVEPGELLRVAESLEEASDDEWARLLDEYEQFPPTEVTVARGEHAGAAWTLRAGFDGRTLCTEFGWVGEAGGGANCGPPPDRAGPGSALRPEPWGHLDVADVDDWVVIDVAGVPEVARLRIERYDESDTTPFVELHDVVRTDVDGELFTFAVVFFLAPVDGDSRVDLVALDADGEELGRESIVLFPGPDTTPPPPREIERE